MDDCYINNKFANYVNTELDKESDIVLFGWYKKFTNGDKWSLWNRNINIFDKNNLCASINQIVRLSPKLISKILEFQSNHNKFIFHELLIASLVSKFN